MPKPTLVIFDMDGVLCRYDFPARMAHMAASTGLSPGAVEEALFTSGWDEAADQGRHDADGYLAGCVERLGTPLSAGQWLAARKAAVTPNSDVLAMAADVGRRTNIAMLTNNGALLQRHFEAFFPEAAALFGQRAFFSGVVGAAKPAAGAFRAVIAAVGGEATRTLFIDDDRDYIAGAAEAGLMTHHFRSADKLRADLVRRGLLHGGKSGLLPS